MKLNYRFSEPYPVPVVSLPLNCLCFGRTIYSLLSLLLALSLALSLAVALALIAVTPAHAKTADWEAESADFNVANLTCEGACHGFAEAPESMRIVDLIVAHDVDSVTVEPPASVGSMYSWRTRLNGALDAGVFMDRRAPGFTFPDYEFPLTQTSLSVDYCIGVDDATVARKYLCDTFVVTRDDPPLPMPPVITSVLPGENITLEMGQEVTITLEVEHEDLSSLQYTGVSSDDSVASVEPGPAGSYTVTGESIAGDASLTLTVSDGLTTVSTSVLVSVVGANPDPVDPDPVDPDPVDPDPVDPDPVDPDPVDPDPVDPDPVDPDPVDPVASGESLYNKDCSGCHSGDVPGVPQLGDAAEWIARLAAAPNGLQTLVDSVVNGKGSMPAYGGTYTTAELREAVVFLTGGVMPPEPDQDGDNVPDDSDNCPTVANTGQADADDDDLGDACDETDGNNPDLPPTAVNDKIIIVDVTVTQLLDVLANDSDPENKSLVIKVDSLNTSSGGRLQLVQDNTKLRYTAPAGLSEADSFSYKAVDPGGLESDSATVDIVPSDTDGDGVFDLADNCDLTPNADQGDMDSDDVGDLCDPDPDGDGTPGLSGQAPDSGKELVESECIVCHLNPNIGAPQFGDEAAWAATLAAAGSIEKLVLSAINGVPNTAMPAFGDKFSAEELTAAVLYLSGNEPDQPGSPVLPTDTDGDGVADEEDNCPRLPNEDQSDEDGNNVGDVCEPTVDTDGDGYIFALDDDDSNANRLPGDSVSTANTAFFISDQMLSLGELALSAATPSSASVFLEDAQFMDAAAGIYPAVQPVLDTAIRNGTRAMDIQLTNTADGTGTLLIHLLTNIPLRPQLRVYRPEAATWSNFAQSDIDSMTSAPAVNGSCPVIDSANYTQGLSAGLSCVRLKILDGGPNDSDATANNKVSLVAQFGTTASDDATGGVPAVVDSSPQKGGGGTTGIGFIGLLGLYGLMRVRKLRPHKQAIQCNERRPDQ